MTKYIFNKNNLYSKLTLIKIFFFFILIIRSLIAINSSSWLTSWIGLEINIIIFIPLILNSTKKIKTSNSIINYFIIQRIASSILILIILFIKLQNNTLKLNFFINLTQLRLIIKLGAFPLHWWIPKIINNISWINCIIILTWQKIAPLFLLANFNNNIIIYISSLISTIIGRIIGINQTIIKLIIAYSSINHIGWILITLLINTNLIIIYLIIYSLINIIISLIINNLNINNLNQLFKNNNQNINNKLIILSLFISLGGLPPIIGFLPKILTLFFILKNKLFIESLLFIIISTISLTFYINPLISIFILSKNNSKWIYLNNNFYKIIFNIIIINIILTIIIIFPIINLI